MWLSASPSRGERGVCVADAPAESEEINLRSKRYEVGVG